MTPGVCPAIPATHTLRAPEAGEPDPDQRGAASSAQAMAATAAGAAPGDRDEATAAVVDEGWNLPTDVFVEILLLLPATRRWRRRIVCRHWRDVIHERTPAPERWSQPLALVFFQNYEGLREVSASAFVIGDTAAGGRGRELWRSQTVPPAVLHRHPKRWWKGVDAFDTMMLGTCNRLRCLCDNTRPGGAISLLNPATGEALTLPPLPGSAQWVWWGMQMSSWHDAYTFAYEPMTEQYKVVHLPCYLDRSGGFNAAQVFALGKAAAVPRSWCDAPTPGASCCLDAGVVSVDGVAYWLTKGAERVVSFDVREERVTSTRALPAQPRRRYSWHLAEVHGRLGLVSSSDLWVTPEKVDVWVLDRQGWSRRRGVQLNDGLRHLTARPHFAHGDYVVTGKGGQVFEHRLGSTGMCGKNIHKPSTIYAIIYGGLLHLKTIKSIKSNILPLNFPKPIK
jgi:F-box interacting protein